MSSSKSMALPVPTHDRAALLGAGGAELELVLLLLLLEPDDDDDEAAAERDERKGDAEMIEAIADGCGAGVLESASRGRRDRGRTGRCQRPRPRRQPPEQAREQDGRCDQRSRPTKRIMGVRRRMSEACMVEQ
jgi:hypothetical protein